MVHAAEFNCFFLFYDPCFVVFYDSVNNVVDDDFYAFDRCCRRYVESENNAVKGVVCSCCVCVCNVFFRDWTNAGAHEGDVFFFKKNGECF